MATATKKRLRQIAGEAMMGGSKQGQPVVKKEIDTSTYRGRFAAQLYAQRTASKVSVDRIIAALEKAEIKIGKAGYYHWESGFSEPPMNALPVIAKVLGVTVPDLFPKK